MAERLPSLELIAREARSERKAQFRHIDAVDAKAGVVIGFSGVIIAVGVDTLDVYRLPGLLAALLSAALAAAVFRPRRHPVWDVRDFRRERLRSEARITALVILDTHIRMIERQRELLHRNAVLLGRSLLALLAAAVLLVAGTMVDYMGG